MMNREKVLEYLEEYLHECEAIRRFDLRTTKDPVEKREHRRWLKEFDQVRKYAKENLK